MRTGAARQTPVFFGSALNDFGVRTVSARVVDAGSAAGAAAERAPASSIRPIPTSRAFVFKIQANMNPRHRDRVAFVRVCSGRLAKDMLVTNTRLGTELRLSRVYRFFGRDRETVPEAFPGDVVGVVNPGRIAIGDTLCAGRLVEFPPIPRFPAEQFAILRPAEIRHKKFDEAVAQLAEEGLCRCSCRSPGHGIRSSASSGACSSTWSKPACAPSTASRARSIGSRTSQPGGQY